ncbi:MAG: hypothetical protein LBC46_06425 [Treponema sp.]|nr:hypothetical protein [Treponema sp.]
MLSLLYGIIGIVFSSSGIAPVHHLIYNRPNEEYIKIVLQSLMGMILLFLPSISRKQIKITFADGMQVMFVLFLFAAIILGEVRNFYRRFQYWDTLLHTFSGVMLGAFGFSFIDILNDNKDIKIELSAKFVSVFAFCFAITIDTFWEILEFTMDVLMDLNMQQYMLHDGTILIGKAAVFDTMKDLIVDTLGALVICITGYFMIKNKKT